MDCAKNWCLIRGLLLYILHRIGDIFSSAHVIVLTFKHIYPLPLVHRPKGALLVEKSGYERPGPAHPHTFGDPYLRDLSPIFIRSSQRGRLIQATLITVGFGLFEGVTLRR